MLLSSQHLTQEETPPFILKGSLFTLTVLHLFQMQRAAIEQHLTEKIKQAPSFFNNTPVVIDLEAANSSDEGLDFQGLYELLRAHGMVPVGIRNGTPLQQAAARLAGLPTLPESRTQESAKKADKPQAARRSKIFEHPVRSGQQVYAPEGDLIVLGTVSPGAEVIADGNIHIYGALRGRALAGVRGTLRARIFCQSMEAELISIAGHYRISEQLDAADYGKAVQIYLLEDSLKIEHLSR